MKRALTFELAFAAVVVLTASCGSHDTPCGGGTSGNHCLPDMSGCTSDADCCGGVCDPNTATCGGNGHVCFPDQTPCNSDAECCAGVCDPSSLTCGQAMPGCYMTGTPCALSSQCCPGLSCQFDTGNATCG
jgi:hypothetical protein